MWNRRTGNSPPPTSNRKDTLQTELLTEHLLNRSRRHQTAERTRKISKSSGRMKGKKRGWRDGTCAPGTELKRGGVPTSWEAPSDPSEARRRAQPPSVAGSRPLHRLECCSPARQPETCVRWYGRACNSGVSARSRRGLLLAVWTRPEGAGVC